MGGQMLCCSEDLALGGIDPDTFLSGKGYELHCKLDILPVDGMLIANLSFDCPAN